MTSSAAMAGMVVGAVVVFAWKSVIPETSEWFNVYEMIPGFILLAWRLLWFLSFPQNLKMKLKKPLRKAEKAYKEAK